MRGLLLLLFLLPAGCIGFTLEHTKIGVVDPVLEARKLEEGKSTLAETLVRLGPPDLLLRAGDVNRAYYGFWDSEYLKFIAKFEIPLLFRTISWDFFIVALGTEWIRLARLDFDGSGVLRERHMISSRSGRSGEFAGLDNSLVSMFLEDRERALQVEEVDDDDEDQ